MDLPDQLRTMIEAQVQAASETKADDACMPEVLGDFHSLQLQDKGCSPD